MPDRSVKVVSRAAAACLVAAALIAAGPAAADAAPYPEQDVTVTSFDGARIKAHFLPAKGLEPGERAPTVLVGSGWSAPPYPSWLPTVEAVALGDVTFDGGALLGPADLSAAGYNVITWANRGWYGSEGQVMIDRPDVEGRDVRALVDWLATHPGAQLDAAGDPRVGMTGASYGGGIQLSAAIVDRRIDVLEPNMSWNELMDALYPNQVPKSGWGNLLCFAAGLTGANLHPTVSATCAAARTGEVTQEMIDFGHASSPGERVAGIRAPTLLLGGSVDTLFPLSGNVKTYTLLRRAGTPVKMMWYCGGHGLCNQAGGAAHHVADAQRAFLARYLNDQDVDLGPGFEYLDQTGSWRSAPRYPVAATRQATGHGAGWLGISPLPGSGLLGIAATSAANAVTVPITAPRTSSDLVGAPTLKLTYRGWATRPRAPIYAQLVDTATGKVVDNQATPVQLTLDGDEHRLTLPLEVVVWNLTPSSRLALQLTDSTNLFFGQQAFGLVHLDAAVTLPLSPRGAPAG